MTQHAHTNIQAIRRINENGHPPSKAAASYIIHVACYPDPAFGKDIVLWDDIRAAFDDVMHVRSGTLVLPFLRGPDLRNLEPLRIAAVPGATLDVVVRKQSRKLDLSSKFLKEALFGKKQKRALSNSTPASITTPTKTTSVKQIPTGNPVEATMKNSVKVDKPAAVTTPLPQPYRGPHSQALFAQLQQDTTPQKLNVPKEAHPPHIRIPTVQTLPEVESKGKLEDKNAQFALGGMYSRDQGAVQSSSQAMEWFEKAVAQGYAAGQYYPGKVYDSGQGQTKYYANAMDLYL
ncbi:MAG: hypothetical protein J3R72DRAFT_493718 [Linnemannia gamsii]|nr:MAG: hypothetical protein J3R72DRAFT_493718 [Linnemannia gamsii]